jgi:hypothetical protein
MQQSLPAGYVPVSAYGGCLKNLKDLNAKPTPQVDEDEDLFCKDLGRACSEPGDEMGSDEEEEAPDDAEVNILCS